MSSRAITTLADDHTIVRQELAKLLDGDSTSVSSEKPGTAGAVSKVEELKPDVFVSWDIAMPVLNGIEATRQIKKVSRNTKQNNTLDAFS